MNTHYAAGRTFEYRLKLILEEYGFYVIRAFQSRGAIDLLAAPPSDSTSERALLVQAKTGKRPGYTTPAETVRLNYLAGRSAGTVIVAYNVNRRVMVRPVFGSGVSMSVFLLDQYGLKPPNKRRKI